MKHKGPTGKKPVGPKKYVGELQPEQSRSEGIQMFSSVLTATDAYPSDTGGRDKITSLSYHSTLQPFGL
jgi:hypothetical protein